MKEVREIKEEELPELLTLYKHLHQEDEMAKEKELALCWQKIIASEFFHYFVIEMDQQLVSSCNLTIVLNLTRGARPFGLIENVVTHADYRKQGLGRKVLQHAIAFAKSRDCYKVMLLSSGSRKEAHHFYETLGFSSDSKTGFVIKF